MPANVHASVCMVSEAKVQTWCKGLYATLFVKREA